MAEAASTSQLSDHHAASLADRVAIELQEAPTELHGAPAAVVGESKAENECSSEGNDEDDNDDEEVEMEIEELADSTGARYGCRFWARRTAVRLTLNRYALVAHPNNVSSALWLRGINRYHHDALD